MNKYQRALNDFEKVFRNITLDDDLTNEKSDILQELVDKETPMKPTSKKVDFINWNYYCKCGEMLDSYRDYRCNECGQKIDWTE